MEQCGTRAGSQTGRCSSGSWLQPGTTGSGCGRRACFRPTGRSEEFTTRESRSRTSHRKAALPVTMGAGDRWRYFED